MISRFELIYFDDETERLYKERIEKEKQERLKKYREYKIKVENGIEGYDIRCEHYGERKLRWVQNDEFYICYECFIQGLQCVAEVMVPIQSAQDLDEYVEEWEWDHLWEQEQLLKDD